MNGISALHSPVTENVHLKNFPEISDGGGSEFESIIPTEYPLFSYTDWTCKINPALPFEICTSINR